MPGMSREAAPDKTAALIDQLRILGITLTYDPDTRILRTSDSGIVAFAVGRAADTRSTARERRKGI